MKTKTFMLIALLLAVFTVFTACSGKKTTPTANSSTSTSPISQSDKAPAFTAGEWPDNEWTQQVPKPSAGTVGKVSTAGAENQTLSIKMDWTREEAAAYCDELVAGNFNQNVLAYYKDSTPMSVLLEAESSDAWEVAVSETEIRIYKP
jgi:hypothetical protein